MTLHPYERGIRPGSLGHGDPTQYDYLTIKSFFANTKPADLEGLQQSYTKLQSALQDLEQRLGQHTRRLNQIWDGDAQEAGTSEIKQLTENTATLAKASAQFGTAMSSGAAALRNPPQITPPSGPAGALPGLIGEAAASPADTKAAQEALAKTNTSLASAFNQIPTTLALGAPKATWDTPYAGAGSGAPGKASGAATPDTGAGIPQHGIPLSGAGGGRAAPMPSSVAPSHGSAPQAGGRPSEAPGTLLPTPSHAGSPTDLAGTGPGLGRNPELAPDSPTTATPTHGGPLTPSLGRVPPALEGPSPWAPTVPSGPPGTAPVPRVVGGGLHLPRFPELPAQGGTPGLGGLHRMSPRGVIGGNDLTGTGGIGQEPSVPYGAPGGARQPSAGEVLRNGVLRPANDGAAGSMMPGRQGTPGAGLPMTGGAGGGGRSGERSRDVYVTEDGTLWDDETEVSPRVLGKPDQTTRSPEHGS